MGQYQNSILRSNVAKILRSFLVLLILANYLFLSGMGFVSRPEQDPFIVLIQHKAAESHHYESRQYMRTEGLEAFMAEALSTRYQDAPVTQNQVLLSVTIAVDAHALPDDLQFQALLPYQPKGNPHHYATMPEKDIALAIYSPPEIFGVA